MKKRVAKSRFVNRKSSNINKKNIMIIILLIIIFTSLFILQTIINNYYPEKNFAGQLGSFKSFSQGSGTNLDPYLITNCFELQNISNELSSYYFVVNDIDCLGFVSPSEINPQSWCGGSDINHNGNVDQADYNAWRENINCAATSENNWCDYADVNRDGIVDQSDFDLWRSRFGDSGCSEILDIHLGLKPIGDALNPFTGTFDGNNHIISNLYINEPDGNYVGLFGYINNSKIANLGLVNVNINGSNFVGAIAGYNTGKILQSYSTGNLNGISSIGGLIGFNFEGNISDSYSTGNINGVSSVGGLIGTNGRLGEVSNSYSSGNVNGNINVGGLIGLVGGNPGNVTNSFSVSNVNGNNLVGGLFGNNMTFVVMQNKLSNLYWNNHSGNPGNCYSGGDMNCTAIRDKVVYFQGDVYPNRKPFISWDFISVWQERTNDYPSLTWQGIGLNIQNDNIQQSWCGGSDINHNGNVDQADYNAWRENENCIANQANDWCGNADVNRNGFVDQSDFDLWRSRFGDSNCKALEIIVTNEPSPSPGGGSSGGGSTGGFIVPTQNQTKSNLTSNNSNINNGSLGTPVNNEEIPIIYKKKEFNIGLYLILFISLLVVLIILSLIILFRLKPKEKKHLKIK